MRKRVWIILLFVLSFLLLNCTFALSPDQENPLQGSITPDPNKQAPSPNEPEGLTILRNQCSSCHGVNGVGGVVEILNVDKMSREGRIIPGNPDGSAIFDSISKLRMPPQKPMGSQEIQIVRKWILDGASREGALPTPTPVSLAATFFSISVNVLMPKCVGCHGAMNPKEGIRYDTYQQTLRSVKIGLPQESKLYKVCLEGEMPERGKGYPAVTSQELAVISQWIQEGAKDN